MNSYMIANGLASLLAVWVGGYHSKEVRNCAVALFLGFLFYISAWLPDGFSPRDIIMIGTGDTVKSPQLWLLCDLLVLLYIATRDIPMWARIFLPLSFLIQIVFHIFRLCEILNFDVYSNALDKIFIVQLSVFFVLGWPNTSNEIKRLIRNNKIRRKMFE